MLVTLACSGGFISCALQPRYGYGKDGDVDCFANGNVRVRCDIRLTFTTGCGPGDVCPVGTICTPNPENGLLMCGVGLPCQSYPEYCQSPTDSDLEMEGSDE